MASLTLEGINKQFGTVRAVDDVNLSIADGEFIAFLGPSGCGKTTTLRMIAGLELPDSGRIQIGGKEVTNLPARARDVAMVFQDYALYPHMSVLENVGYPLKVRGIPADTLRERVTQVADQLQIGTLLERRPGQLSGGQQQRVALARAVVHKAQVTLYDEPLSNLDTKLRLEARAFLKRLQQDVGVTSVYVTHDQAEAMALADRIVVMNLGRVMQVSTPMEVYRRPADVFVAAFIGSPPMNLLPCQIDAAARSVRFDTGDTLQFATLPAGFERAAQRGGQLTLGIRPEHITLHTTPVAGALPGKLYVTQLLGSEALIMVSVGTHLVSVTVDVDALLPQSEQVWMQLNSERIFFYDAEGKLIA
jgi:multiple sugar transport system ATP-binding protein